MTFLFSSSSALSSDPDYTPYIHAQLFSSAAVKRIAKLGSAEGKGIRAATHKQISNLKNTAAGAERSLRALVFVCGCPCGAASGKKESFVPFALQKEFALPGNRGRRGTAAAIAQYNLPS